MKKKLLSIATICALLSAISIQAAFADNFTTTATLSGSVSVSGGGDWAGTIGMTGNVSATAASTATWTGQGATGATDYIQVVDNKADADGAYLTVAMNSAKYTYSGLGAGNTDLVHATATYMINNSSAVAPTYGKDDTSKSANLITSATCDTEELPSTNLLFHTNLRSASQFYKLTLTTSAQRLFRIMTTSECTTTVKLAFDYVVVTYPALTTSGTYSNTIVLTMTDGS